MVEASAFVGEEYAEGNLNLIFDVTFLPAVLFVSLNNQTHCVEFHSLYALLSLSLSFSFRPLASLGKHFASVAKAICQETTMMMK